MLQLFLRSAEDTDKRARWAANRASGSFPSKGKGTGNAPGTQEALSLTNALTLVCKTKRCNALVHKKAATRQATLAGRKHFEPGDGCGSRLCTKGRFREPRFQAAQNRMRAQLAEGSRLAVLWPSDTLDKSIVLANQPPHPPADQPPSPTSPTNE